MNPFKFVLPEDEPLIKLTDSMLARKIDHTQPWLNMRCGSESYAGRIRNHALPHSRLALTMDVRQMHGRS